MKIKISEVLDKIDGKLMKGTSEDYFSRLVQNSLEIQEGDTFVAAKGERADGHNYIKSAIENGAKTCIITDDTIDLSPYDITIVYVKEHRRALQIIVKEMMKKMDIKKIAITGSVGKTSTREAVYNVVSQKYNTYETEKNYNGVIGLPLTASKLEDEELAVFEMGMNGKGEIEILTDIVRPDIAVITNIGSSHIGILGSIENILKAKMEIVKGIPKDGYLLLNADDKMLQKVIKEKEKYDCNVITFGIEENADYKVENINIIEEEGKSEITVNGKVYELNSVAKHDIYNNLVAIVVGNLLKMTKEEIQKGLLKIEKEKRRLEKIEVSGMTIYDDTYNASYESVKAAIETLDMLKVQGRMVYILGDVFELNDFAEEYHRKIGKVLAKAKIDLLITAGEYSKYINEEVLKEKNIENYHFKDNNEVIRNLNLLKKGDTVLIKASNGMKFDEIVKSINGE